MGFEKWVLEREREDLANGGEVQSRGFYKVKRVSFLLSFFFHIIRFRAVVSFPFLAACLLFLTFCSFLFLLYFNCV